MRSDDLISNMKIFFTILKDFLYCFKFLIECSILALLFYSILPIFRRTSGMSISDIPACQELDCPETSFFLLFGFLILVERPLFTLAISFPP